MSPVNGATNPVYHGLTARGIHQRIAAVLDWTPATLALHLNALTEYCTTLNVQLQPALWVLDPRNELGDQRVTLRLGQPTTVVELWFGWQTTVLPTLGRLPASAQWYTPLLGGTIAYELDELLDPVNSDGVFYSLEERMDQLNAHPRWQHPPEFCLRLVDKDKLLIDSSDPTVELFGQSLREWRYEFDTLPLYPPGYAADNSNATSNLSQPTGTTEPVAESAETNSGNAENVPNLNSPGFGRGRGLPVNPAAGTPASYANAPTGIGAGPNPSVPTASPYTEPPSVSRQTSQVNPGFPSAPMNAPVPTAAQPPVSQFYYGPSPYPDVRQYDAFSGGGGEPYRSHGPFSNQENFSGGSYGNHSQFRAPYTYSWGPTDASHWQSSYRPMTSKDYRDATSNIRSAIEMVPLLEYSGSRTDPDKHRKFFEFYRQLTEVLYHPLCLSLYNHPGCDYSYPYTVILQTKIKEPLKGHLEGVRTDQPERWKQITGTVAAFVDYVLFRVIDVHEGASFGLEAASALRHLVPMCVQTLARNLNLIRKTSLIFAKGNRLGEFSEENVESTFLSLVNSRIKRKLKKRLAKEWQHLDTQTRWNNIQTTADELEIRYADENTQSRPSFRNDSKPRSRSASPPNGRSRSPYRSPSPSRYRASSRDSFDREGRSRDQFRRPSRDDQGRFRSSTAPRRSESPSQTVATFAESGAKTDSSRPGKSGTAPLALPAPPNSNTDRPRREPGPDDVCHNCGKKGHFRATCPEPRRPGRPGAPRSFLRGDKPLNKLTASLRMLSTEQDYSRDELLEACQLAVQEFSEGDHTLNMVSDETRSTHASDGDASDAEPRHSTSGYTSEASDASDSEHFSGSGG